MNLTVPSLVLTIALAVVACGDEEPSSSGAGASGPASSSTGTAGTGGAGASGGAQGGAGQGGAGGMNGSGGFGMVGTGGQGECISCGEYIDTCWQSSCPHKNTLCNASIQAFSGFFGCMCPICYDQCPDTCSSEASDQPGCLACQQDAAAGSCINEYAACQAD